VIAFTLTRGQGRAAGSRRGGRVPQRVLVVESEPDVATVVRLALRPSGYQVSWAGDLAMARVLLKDRPPGLVILELRLHDGDGLDLCRQLRAERPSLPIVVLTTRVEARETALAAGATAFLTKPFEVDELEAQVRRLLPIPDAPGGRPRRA
jgi:DNA-binding response OmpR family regulator